MPTCKVAVSASHNWIASQAEADERIKRKAERDRKAGRRCISHNFMRVIDALIDENKCLMPIYRKVPLLAFKLIPRIMQGLEVVVIGSREVELVVNSLQDCFGIDDSRLRYVQEHLSLAQNIAAGARALKLLSKEGFVFESGDTPFGTLDDLLRDPAIADHVLVADLNGRQTAFNGTTEFFTRNYYWKVKYNGKYIEAKEPNAWLFREDFPFDVIDSFYDNRQGGKLNMMKAIKLVGSGFIKQFPHFSVTTGYDLGRGLLQAITGSSPLKFHTQSVGEMSAAFFNGQTAYFKVSHQDPFRIKDVDAWHDLWFYHHLVNYALEKGGLESITPHASAIKGYADFIDKQDLRSEIGVLKDFPSYANTRAAALDVGYQPFSRGEFCAPLEDGADISAAYGLLQKRRKEPSVVKGN